MTYGYCKKIIASGKYDKNEMKDKLDVFLLANRITDDEYKELVAEIDQQLVSPISPPVHPRYQAFYDKYCLTEQGTTASERLLATLTNQDKGERQLGE